MARVGFNPKLGTIKTDARYTVDQAFIAHINMAAPDAVDTDGVLTALNGAVHTGVVANITNPDFPRTITATAGGTAADIKAIQVVIAGTNQAGETITETLPAFTVDTAGTVESTKAFKTVTQIDIPAHDGTGATTSVGWGKKFGVPYMLPFATLVKAFFNGSADAGTLTVDADEIEKNLFAVNGTPDGLKDIDLYIMV